MKIVGFDEASNSLLVSFASDETASQNPEDYSPVAFQPATMWPDITDLGEIKKRIAVAGMYTASTRANFEKLHSDLGRISALKGLVGQTASFAISDLETPSYVSNDSITTV
jgi:hypothetical protein